jgi:hypothetical protein
MAGRRIDDHSSWIGSGSNGTVFPQGVKLKSESSAEGAGSIGMYEDTTQSIKTCQEMGVKKIKSQKPKEYYRN